MDITPAILIFTPIFLPIAQHLGIDPIHFGIIMVFNLTIGLCTPPVGTILFVGCSIGKVSIDRGNKTITADVSGIVCSNGNYLLFPAA